MGSLLKFVSSSSVLGFIDDIIDNTITLLVGPILWALCDIFFLIIDMFDGLYKRFAGIADITIDGVVVDQDPVLYMINTDVVQEMFFSILTLSMILLIIFTIFAIVKNIYAEKPKPPRDIINSSVKALLMYLLVPVATVVCLLVGNIVLRAIDGATKLGGASTTSDLLFISAAYNANKIRADGKQEVIDMLNDGHLKPIATQDSSGSQVRYEAYVAGMARNGINVNGTDVNEGLIDIDEVADLVDEAYLAGIIGGNKWYFGTVRDYYYVLKINLITVWGGGVFLIFALGKITWGLVSRLFKMTLFYAISPAMMAVFPIKGDAALKSWTSEMVKNGTMAYCAIGVLNMVLSILPAFNKLKLFGNGFLDGLAVLFIDIVALTSAEKLIGTVSGWFGTGDAMAEGKAAQSAAMKPVKATANKATGAFAGSIAGAKKAKENGGSAFAGFVSGAMGGAGLKNPITKTIQDGKKAGEDKYKEMATTNILTGDKNSRRAAEFEGREKVAAEKKQMEELQTKYSTATTDDERKKIAAQMAQLETVKQQTDDRRAQLDKNEKVTTAQTENLGVFKQLDAAKQEVMAQAYQILGREADASDIAALMRGNTFGLDPDQLARWNENSGAFMSSANRFNEQRQEVSERLATDTKFAAQARTAGLDNHYDSFDATDRSLHETAIHGEDRRLKVSVQTNKDARDNFENGTDPNGIINTVAGLLSGRVVLTDAEYRELGKGKK